MEENIICPSNPYELDYLSKCGKVALTCKNRDFIEAVINVDSNYKREWDKSEKYDTGLGLTDSNISEVFGSEKKNKGKAKYCGSIAYWFDCIEKNKDFCFENALLGAITAIDRSNSTHLEASKDGRKKIKERIIEKGINNYNLLKKIIDEGLGKDGGIIRILTAPLEGEKGEERFNLSFASKFCSYASIFLLNKDKYPRYDNIVCKNLNTYVQAYLGENPFKLSDIKMNAYNMKSRTISNYIKLYENFSKYLESIKEKCNEIERDKIGKNIDEITLSQIDHIIWYTNK